MTGFLFGLGLTVAIGQLPKLLGVEETSGRFFEQLWDLLGRLGDAHGWTVVVGVGSVALLVALRRFAPTLPGMLIVLAAEEAGGKTQVTSIVAAGLILLTGLFLTGLFEDLPQATLGAIVIVAISGFWRVDELVRFARLRTSAIVFALVALLGVMVLGILPGLVVAALLSLVSIVQLLSRLSTGALARDQ